MSRETAGAVSGCQHVHLDGTCVTICSPSSVLRRSVMHCPTCGRRRRFVGRLFVWYDPIWTCLGCGDRWSAGERLGRPFRRGWREEQSARAAKDWAAAPTLADSKQQERAMFDAYFGEPVS